MAIQHIEPAHDYAFGNLHVRQQREYAYQGKRQRNAWDIENRLAAVTLPGAGGSVSFMYDPFERRIQKSSAAGTTNYVYDGANARYSQGQGIDQPLAVVRQGTAAYYKANGSGSITLSRDVSRSVVATYSYDAFGNTTATSSINNPFQYTGREFDSETGLYHYREVGRRQELLPLCRKQSGGPFGSVRTERLKDELKSVLLDQDGHD